MFHNLTAVVVKAKKSYGGKAGKATAKANANASGDALCDDGPRAEIETFEAKMQNAHVERFESHRSAKRAEGHVFDDDDAPAVSSVARGSDEETAEPAAIDDKDTGNPDSEHPLGVLNGAAATASDAAFTKLAAGDETGGPKLTEEEETEEEEEEHDENDDENDENAAADTPVEPVVKKARKGAAAKTKEATKEAKGEKKGEKNKAKKAAKAEESQEEPVRTSRRALRAK